VPYGTCPNPALFVLRKLNMLSRYIMVLSQLLMIKIREKYWTYFMLSTLGAIGHLKRKGISIKMSLAKLHKKDRKGEVRQ